MIKLSRIYPINNKIINEVNEIKILDLIFDSVMDSLYLRLIASKD